MAVIVVEEETDLAGLTDRLLRRNASDKTRAAAARALREANPGVDLRRIRRGTVVVVPDLHAGLANPSGSLEEGLARATDPVGSQLDGLRGALADGAAAAALRRERAGKALADPAVRKSLRGSEAGKAVGEQLERALERAAEAAEEQRELVEGALDTWTEDLAALRSLWPDEK